VLVGGRISSCVCVGKKPYVCGFVEDFHEIFYSHMGRFVFERSVSQTHFFHGSMYRFGREARGISGMRPIVFLAALLSILSIMCNCVSVNISRWVNYFYYVPYRDVSLPVLLGPHYRTDGASTIRRLKKP